MRAAELVRAAPGPMAQMAQVGSRTGRAPIDAAIITLGALSLGAFLAFGDPILLVIPLVPIAAVAAARHPELGVGGVLATLGFSGTLTAHTAVPIWLVVHLLLAGLWAGVVATLVFGSSRRSTWLWPGLLLPVVYVGLSVVQVWFSDHTINAVTSIRTSTYFLVIGLLIALAPWSRETYVRMAKGAVLVGLAVGGYAVFRFVVGSSGAEQQLALIAWTSVGRPAAEEPQFFGSFAFGPELASYAAALIPFTLALVLGGLGRRAPGAPNGWRLVGAIALAALVFALLATEVRTGLLAAIAGSAVVVLLFGLAPSFPSGRRIATVTVTVCAVTLVGAGFYTLAVTDEQDRARYERLFTDPAGDPAYATRLERWDHAVAVASREPFGHGLGTQGAVGQARPEGQVGPFNVDSSYLKIAIEQGFVVLGLYVAALLSLLVGLGAFVRLTRSRTEAALAIGSAGTLMAAAVLFYAGMSIEGTAAVPLWILVGIGAAMPATRAIRRPLSSRSSTRTRPGRSG